ncbi:unnamed protein product [Trifolium pratense]|uniref:Uncharacterized protein n=1 Tax=Trifolium pratense TaxID=57577 RepID=A0ACB0IJZ0_TRIPR|nr:unnamed protein product [Trifolium pratense]
MISESEASSRKNDVKDRRLSIIDFLSADDSLLEPNSPNHQQNSENEAWYTPNSKKFEDAATKIEQWENEPLTSETKTKKNPKCNLRKSLAWDNAFFTNAGVLDAEELSSIIEGVEKEELPRIEEDVYKSCDSVSTLGSDCLTLESVELEGDFFEDVRASIQKSSHKSKLASAATRVSSTSRLPGLQTRDSSRKVSAVPGDKMKVPPASRNPTAVMRGIGKSTNKNNSTFTQIPQPVAMRRESSISKLSKVPAKPSASSTISSKRVSLSDKSEMDKAKLINGRVSSMSKASVIGGSRGTVPKPTVLSKLNSGQLVSTKTKSATSTSSGVNLSDNIGKSPLNSGRKKVIAVTTKVPSSRPPVRTPSGFASRNKSESGNSSLSSLISVNKLSSSVSPASSVSDWSSEASVSTSIPTHVCDSLRSSIDSTSSRKVLSYTNVDQGVNSQTPRSDMSLENREAQHTGIISQSVTTASVAAVIPTALAKPSGLRLPSPKIGFFDGVKSSVRTPRGGAQPHSAVPHSLLKRGAGSPSEGQNKAKLGKLQAVRSITPTQSKKPNNLQSQHPNHVGESLDVAIKTSSAEHNVKTSSEMLNGANKNVEYTSLSHEMEKTGNDLSPLTRVDHQGNVCHDDQVDCLIKQVGLMDINSKTQVNINGDSLSFCETDVSFQDKSNAMELSTHKELFDHPKNQQLLKGSSTPYLCVTPTTSIDMAASVRRPFAAKDSFCNMDCSVFTEPTVSEVKQANLPLPESITKEKAEMI